MRKISLATMLLCLFILGMESINAQDFSGQWEGKLTVSDNGQEGILPFKMVINTDGNGNCGGQSSLWIIVDDVKYFVIYKFSGTYSGSTLKFKDGEIVESKDPGSPDFYWCEKSGTLYLNGNTITGDVTGYSPKGGCMPAKLLLQKVSK